MTDVVKTPPKDARVMSIFQSPQMKEELKKALPKHLTADRMLRIALTEVRKNPKLLECTKESFAGALMETSQLGLEPGGYLGHTFLQPTWNGKLRRQECQLILGYKGMLELVRRTAKINRIRARAVYENDLFEYEYGTHEKIRHIPCTEGNKGEVVLFYSTAHIAATGECLFEIMTKSQVDAIRDEVFRKNKYVGGPWAEHYEEMAKKTVLRRAFKYLPISTEIAQAITLDELAEAGVQDNSTLIDSTELTHDKHHEPDEEIESKIDLSFDPKTGELLEDAVTRSDEDGFDD